MNMVHSNPLYTLRALEQLYGSSTDLYMTEFNSNELADFLKEATTFDSKVKKFFAREDYAHGTICNLYIRLFCFNKIS